MFRDPQTPCKSLPALLGVSHTLGLKTPGRCTGAWAEQGQRHTNCKIHPAQSSRGNTECLAQSFPQYPAQAVHSKLLLQGAALHVWLGVPPAANLALQSLRGEESSAEQQTFCSYIGVPCPLTAAKLLLQKAGAAGVPRVAGIAADANKVLFSLPFMQFLAGASLSPQRPHPESSCSLILYAK